MLKPGNIQIEMAFDGARPDDEPNEPNTAFDDDVLDFFLFVWFAELLGVTCLPVCHVCVFVVIQTGHHHLGFNVQNSVCYFFIYFFLLKESHIVTNARVCAGAPVFFPSLIVVEKKKQY